MLAFYKSSCRLCQITSQILTVWEYC
jgi:hypothetical protein